MSKLFHKNLVLLKIKLLVENFYISYQCGLSSWPIYLYEVGDIHHLLLLLFLHYYFLKLL